MDIASWAMWLREGQFLSFLYEKAERKYYMVKRRELAHYEYEWTSEIDTLTASGPTTISDLEVTVPWTQMNQLIFGVTPQCYVYVKLPTDVDRHGIPKRPAMTPGYRTVGHFGMHDSPFDCPSWHTEHFMQRPINSLLSLTIYNKTPIGITPKLNFFINKMELEHIGDEFADGTQGVSERANKKPNTKWTETLDKLCKRMVPQRMITLLAVRAPQTTT